MFLPRSTDGVNDWPDPNTINTIDHYYTYAHKHNVKFYKTKGHDSRNPAVLTVS